MAEYFYWFPRHFPHNTNKLSQLIRDVLAKRRRVCAACALKNRRAAYRASKSKKAG